MVYRKFLAVGLLAAFALPVAADDIDGKWNASVPTDFGEFLLTFEFLAEGKELKGSMSNDFMGAIPISEGKVEGKEISFKMAIDAGGPAMSVNFLGVLEGDELELTSTIEGGAPGGGPAEQTMTATRAE